jgi:hypothetical protein
MANFINAVNITANSATLEYEVTNTFGRTVYAYVFQGPAGLTFAQLEANPGLYGKQGKTIATGTTNGGSVSITGLSPGTSYTFLMTVTDENIFDPADTIFRRPLNPPGTFTTLSAPVYTDSTVKSTATVGVFYSDGVSATGATSYSLASGSLPPGIGLSSNNGSISGTPTSSGNYSFRVSANNSAGSTLTSTLSISVAPPAPVWIDQTINPTAFEDAFYSDGVSASNSPTYSISGGSLPSGISLSSSTGAITGTPTVPGTYNFTVRAANATGAITTGLTLEVISGLAPPVFTDDTLSPNLRVGSPYADGVAASDAASYAVAGTIIPGLTLNTTNGSVTGTPTAQGDFAFDIQAINAAGTAVANFDLTVAPSLRYYDGSIWKWATTLKRWDGSEWVNVERLRKWNGSIWENADG